METKIQNPFSVEEGYKGSDFPDYILLLFKNRVSILRGWGSFQLLFEI